MVRWRQLTTFHALEKAGLYALFLYPCHPDPEDALAAVRALPEPCTRWS